MTDTKKAPQPELTASHLNTFFETLQANIAASKFGEEQRLSLLKELCAGQVFSDTTIGCLIADCCSKALGGKLPSFECSRTLL